MSIQWLVALIAVCVAVSAWCATDLLTRGLARYRQTFETQAAIELRDLYLFIDPVRLWTFSVALTGLVAGLLGIFTRSPALSLGVAALAGLLPYAIFRQLRRRRVRRLEAQLPDALAGLAGALRAGQGLSGALRHGVAQLPAPLAQEWSLVLREQRLGVPLEQAFAHFAQRLPVESIVMLVAALRVAVETGGSLADNLERISATVRAQLHLLGKIDALTAQGRLQAWVMGLLPLTLIGVLHRLEPQTMELLWTSGPGWAVLAVVALLETLGIWWIRRIVQVDV